MFKLDERIENSTVQLGMMGISRVLLSKDANYPWVLLIPEIEGATEMHELTQEQQQDVTKAMTFVSTILKDYFKADKMNVANLGNIVSQLHIHVVARFEGDLAWPDPIWGHSPAKEYEQQKFETLCKDLKTVLKLN
ncbi:MAG: HIT family protein [Proteobacteria bacterium]|nr:HIT family protein [Pseudomonadota bacterium]